MSVSTAASSHASYAPEDKFDISSQGITDLTQVNIPNVAVVIASNNQLQSFAGLPPGDELQVLVADNNEFEVINTGELANCPSLSTLILTSNLVTKIPKLGSLKQLKVLDLSGNRLTVCENIEGNQNLRRLLLSKNRIHSIVLHKPLSALSMIDLRYNQIDQMNFGRMFPNLTSIHLDHCFISSFSGLNEMKTLKRVTLSFNKIADNQVLSLPNLEYLNVSNNSLVSLVSFKRLQKLIVLDVSFNPIDDRGFQEAGKLQSIRVLKAAGTRIVCPAVLNQVCGNAEQIDLAGTRIVDITEVQTFVKNAKLIRSLDLRETPLTEHLYPDLNGKTLGARDEFESLSEYDRMFPDTVFERSKYRKQVLMCSADLEVLDGIVVKDDEAQSMRQKRFTEQVNVRPSPKIEQKEVKMQTMWQSSGTDSTIHQLEEEQGRLQIERERLHSDLQGSLERILDERDRLREVLELSDVQRQDLSQLTLEELEDMMDKLQNENELLIRQLKTQERQKTPKKMQRQEGHSSEYLEELIQEHERLKAQVDQIRSMSGATDENTRALCELEKSNRQAGIEQERMRAKLEKKKSKLPRRNTPQEQKKYDRQSEQGTEVQKGNERNPPDEKKVALVSQLMAENALLRDQLGLERLLYREATEFDAEQIDEIIDQLLRHNKGMREQADQQALLIAQQPPEGLDPHHPMNSSSSSGQSKFEVVADLIGNPSGCNFWVPLYAEPGKKEQKYMNRPVKQLPISVAKKPKNHGCAKCAKAMLMMARVPPYPPNSSQIESGCDEFQLVEAWLAALVNRKVTVKEVSKSALFWKFIENERTMRNIHLVVVATGEAGQMITNGVDSPIVVADHGRYVSKELKERGESTVMIAGFDGGNQAVNYCEHTVLPNVQEMMTMNQAYDSLRFQFQGDEAVLTLDPSRLVPLYAVHVVAEQ